jgi:hypothetical protein
MSIKNFQKRLLSRPEQRWNIKTYVYVKEPACENLGSIQNIITTFQNDNIKMDMKELQGMWWRMTHK